MKDPLVQLHTIKIEYGSESQKEVGEKVIEAMMIAFKVSFESRHKKNKMVFDHKHD